ncbi:MAG TPA: CHAT domain-containing protein [Pedococcus sp.]|nr:CHAT domain-containing protein [Pedococcus sp.]
MLQLLEQGRHLNSIGRFRDAERCLRRALRLADALSGEARELARGRVLITLAWATVALHGRDRALALLEDVRTSTGSPRLHALAGVQEAVVQVACQDWRGALAALARVERPTELLTPREQVSALLNGGLAHLSLLELDPARDELERALAIAVAEGVPEQEFKARHNLGCLAFYAGRLPEAITLMREADAMEAPVGRVRAQHDLALVLLEAGLLDEARETLARALGEALAEGHRLEEADLRVDLATCALLRDDPAAAREHLGAAATAYRTRGATDRQRYAALLRSSVDLAEGVVPRGLDRVVAPWHEVARPVLPDERLATRVEVEAALLRGDLDAAGAAVGRLGGRVRQGLAADMHERLLVARVAVAQGDRARARRPGRSALQRLTDRVAPTQSLEIRSALALHGQQLADFDVTDALADGTVGRVFDSVERWRAVSHRLAPVTVPTDSRAASLLAELRQARREAADSADGSDAARLRSRAADLEWQVSQLDWATAEDRGAAGRGAPTAYGTARRLLHDRGEQAVVMFAHDGEQHALVVGATSSVHHLGPAPRAAELADRLSRDLRAHAFAGPHPALQAAVGRAVEESLGALGDLLLGPLPLVDGPVVVVPGLTLRSVPWGMLPRLAGRAVTVAPSMTRWSAPLLEDGPAAERPLTVTALTGPRLRRADVEAERVTAHWRTRGVAARVALLADSGDVREALGVDGLVHVAAHGTHEPQSPWFSSLHMADGPVFAHELPRPAAPRHVVLSACDVGRMDPRPGDEPLGLTAALLGLGVRSVVAAVAPVTDEVAATAMEAYHAGLASGRSASAALAAVVAQEPAAGAFCLYGTDWQPPVAASAGRAGTTSVGRARRDRAAVAGERRPGAAGRPVGGQIQIAGSRNIAS